MKLIICKHCNKQTKKFNRDGSLFCDRVCYMNWKKINPNKKAYKEKVIISGYCYIYKPEHPYAIKRKRYVAEHRLVMEKFLGRYLTEQEVIHHLNGIKTDNRLENLLVLNFNEHNKYHALTRERDLYGKFK